MTGTFTPEAKAAALALIKPHDAPAGEESLEARAMRVLRETLARTRPAFTPYTGSGYISLESEHLRLRMRFDGQFRGLASKVVVSLTEITVKWTTRMPGIRGWFGLRDYHDFEHRMNEPLRLDQPTTELLFALAKETEENAANAQKDADRKALAKLISVLGDL